jgi:hypothetical protein
VSPRPAHVADGFIVDGRDRDRGEVTQAHPPSPLHGVTTVGFEEHIYVRIAQRHPQVLHTEIEGSTLLTVHLGNRYPEVLATHCALIRAACAAHEGHEVDTQGDSFFVVFPRATQAVAAAAAMQRALAATAWPEGGAVRVSIGLHTGEPIRTAAGVYGAGRHPRRTYQGRRPRRAGAAVQVDRPLGRGRPGRRPETAGPRRISPQEPPPSRTHLPAHHLGSTGRLPAPPVARYAPARARAGADDGALHRHCRLDGTARRAGRPLVARGASAVHRARPPGAGPLRGGRR